MLDHPLLGNMYHYSDDYGGFVNSNHERVAQFVKDYDDELELGWIPPANRDSTDSKPFCIIHNNPNGSRQTVTYFYESELNIDHVAMWLMENDFKRNHPNEIFDRVQAGILAKQIADAKATEDAAAEKWEFGKSLLRSPLNVYRHNGKVYRD